MPDQYNIVVTMLYWSGNVLNLCSDCLFCSLACMSFLWWSYMPNSMWLGRGIPNQWKNSPAGQPDLSESTDQDLSGFGLLPYSLRNSLPPRVCVHDRCQPVWLGRDSWSGSAQGWWVLELCAIRLCHSGAGALAQSQWVGL